MIARLCRWLGATGVEAESRRLDREISEEISLHLALAERDLSASGLGAEAAVRESRRRFGDIEVVRRACRRVALGERIMLERINCALLVLVVILLGVGLYRSGSVPPHAPEALSEPLALGNRRPMAVHPASATTYTMVGRVARPGEYDFPAGGRITLRRALVAAGGAAPDAAGVVVTGPDGTARFELGAGDLRGSVHNDVDLQPGDTVRVH